MHNRFSIRTQNSNSTKHKGVDVMKIVKIILDLACIILSIATIVAVVKARKEEKICDEVEAE